MLPLFILAAVVLIAIMFLAVKAHRHITETWLARHGVRTVGQVVTVAPPMSAGLISRLTKTVTVISYTGQAGEPRALIPRSGTGTFTVRQATGAVTVVYDGRRPHNDDRMRVGFGAEPATWHRVRLRDADAA